MQGSPKNWWLLGDDKGSCDTAAIHDAEEREQNKKYESIGRDNELIAASV